MMNRPSQYDIVKVHGAFPMYIISRLRFFVEYCQALSVSVSKRPYQDPADVVIDLCVFLFRAYCGDGVSIDGQMHCIMLGVNSCDMNIRIALVHFIIP